MLEGDGSAQDLHESGLEVIHITNDAKPIRISYLSGGMASGKPSVAFIFELPDGKHYVVAETSAALFCAAGRAIQIKASLEGFDV